jgi:hypothetical protein
MKKIILPLLLFPLAAWAQMTVKPLSQVSSEHYFPYVKENYSNFPREQANVQAGTPIVKDFHPASFPPAAYKPSVTTFLGTTTYDLQTNAALAKRLQLYSGGKLSFVWTKSDGTDPAYPQRWTGYNSYNGTAWTGQNGPTQAIEYDRSGWPNVGAVTVGGSTFEVLTSHYAAAGGTNYAGGIYWYKNSGIGGNDNIGGDFKTKIVDLSNGRDTTQGLLWPRMATSGDKIFLIGTYQSDGSKIKAGVKNPVVYFCYNMTLKTFTAKNIALPGYDSTRYVWGAGDDYSIDARGPYVAVLIGGANNDLALWKSSDSGKNFTKTVIVSFKYAPYDYKIDPSWADTIVSNDGSGTVSLGSDGVAHVVWSSTPVVNSNPNGQDSGVSYLGSPVGIMYWNDVDQKQVNVGPPVDYDHNGTIDLTSLNLNSNNAGYPGHNFSSYPNIAIDPSNHIYVVYSSPHETDLDVSGAAFRHVYVAAFDGTKWHDPQDLIQSWGVENAYPTVARDADGNILHLTFMRRGTAGIAVPGTSNQPITTDTMYYAAISTNDILQDKVGRINLGVNNNTANNLFTLGTAYPNPANNNLNLGLSLRSSANVSVRFMSVLGQEIASRNYGFVPAGNNQLNFDISNFPTGVYMLNVTAGGYTTSERIVIER